MIDRLWQLSPPHSSTKLPEQHPVFITTRELEKKKKRKERKVPFMSSSKKERGDFATLPVCVCLRSVQGGRANGRGNGTINRGAGRGNGASGVHKSANSLAIQDASGVEYTSIRKFRKVQPALTSLKGWMEVDHSF